MEGLQAECLLLAHTIIPVNIITDHLNLKHWREPQNISHQIARWVLELAEYNIEIHHVKGSANGRADALSRRPDYDQGTGDNQDIVVLPDECFVNTTTIIAPETTQQEDRLKSWVELRKVNGVWYKQGRRVHTGGIDETQEIIKKHHDTPVHGHPGIAQMIQLVERTTWWPNLQKDVAAYVKGCVDCQRNKVNNRPTCAPLHPIYTKEDTSPFEVVAIDFITKLPESDGYNSILTVTNHDCSKASIFIPCREEISSEQTAALYVTHVFARFGLPSKIISDCDLQFVSRFSRELCRILGIQQNISTAYHPRTDGQSKRMNQWLEQYLRFWVNERQNDWAKYLPIAEFVHNNWASETTRESPFHILMGYHPRADWTDAPTTLPRVSTRLEQLQAARDKAQELMQRAQRSWVKHKDTPRYQVGDQVWLEGRHLHTHQPTTKLAPKRHGPFRIVQVMSPVNYHLQLPTQWSIHDVFHTDLLTPYRETLTHGPNYLRPPPELVEGVEEFEVEKILDSRRRGQGRKLQYLVKWMGYPDSDNQWEDWDQLTADNAIREFKCTNPESEIHLKAGRIDCTTLIPTARMPCRSFSPEHTRPTYDNNNDVDDSESSLSIGPATQALLHGQAEHQRHLERAREHEPGWSGLPSSTSGPAQLGTGSNRSSASSPSDSPHPWGAAGVPLPETEGEHWTPPASTPYPAIISLRGSTDDGNDDTDIWCGKCGQPMGACHCDALPVLSCTHQLTVPGPSGQPAGDDISILTPIPGRGTDGKGAIAGYVVHDLTQDTTDDEEENKTLISTSGGVDDEETNDVVAAVVPDGVGGGGSRPAYNRGNRGRGQGCGGLAAQARRIARDNSPTPNGYVRNRGLACIPVHILADGRRTPAKYIHVIMSGNPEVYACMGHGLPIYCAEVHAAPMHDMGRTPDYTHEELQYLQGDYRGRRQVDNAIARLGDALLGPEVHRFRECCKVLDKLQASIKRLEDDLFAHSTRRRQSVHCLAQAHALRRIQDEHETDVGLTTVPNWVVERGRSR